jgi:hypothetical protein
MISRRAVCFGSVAVAGLLPFSSVAQEAVAPDVMIPPSQTLFAVTSKIEDLINAYVEKSGLAAREARGELALLKGIAPVTVPSTNPDWVKHRSLAYEMALRRAKVDWVSQQNKSNTTSLVNRAYQAANQDPPPFKSDDLVKPAQLAEIVAKVQALGIGYLDQALRELGIDPAKFEKAPPAQKHVQMSNDILKVSTTRAVGDLVGLTTVQTFEGHDGKGNHQIGVVAVVSPKMKSFAQSVLRMRGNFPADKSKAQDLSIFMTNKDALLQDFGTRWLYDQDGLPVLVSFYQWGLNSAGNDPVLAAQFRQMALKTATELADSQIAQFLASNATLTTRSEVGERYEKAVERAIDGYIADTGATTKLIDGLDQVFEERARVENVTGLRTLTTWGAKHPVGGQMVVGVIRVWSAASEQATRAVKDSRPLTPPAPARAAPSGAPGATQGRDFNSANDF